ncbi:glycosyltransferase family 2 protein [Pedobacter borealis]|uniref:glycosyltransferase family 2 protein n=1 Tax=Pedobacter borealis TaxID=475254 RepID=UPI000492F9E4|nr:glycosyltransferase [Pedobacter borealis]
MSVTIDIIILSNGKTDNLIKLTNQTIESLTDSEDQNSIMFNILVIESNSSLKPYQYLNAKTIYPETEFGFHKYLNIGLAETNKDLVCFCNNDLIFNKGWASAILAALEKDSDIYSVSTFCPSFHADKEDEIPNEINYGYKNGVFFTGWCFFVKRSIFKIIGPFDEHFIFWYADDDFRLTLQKYGLKNVLVKSAKVKHLGSETLDKEQSSRQFRLRFSANAYFRYKWINKNYIIFLYHKTRYIFNSTFKD